MDMNEEYGLTPYETKSCFIKLTTAMFEVEILYIRKTCGCTGEDN